MNTEILLAILAGLVAITLIDTVGAIASRKFKFPYVYLTVLSVAVYFVIGYLVANNYGLYRAAFTNGILGFYDGSIGFWLSVKLGANTSKNMQELIRRLNLSTAGKMAVFAIIIALIANLFV